MKWQNVERDVTWCKQININYYNSFHFIYSVCTQWNKSTYRLTKKFPTADVACDKMLTWIIKTDTSAYRYFSIKHYEVWYIIYPSNGTFIPFSDREDGFNLFLYLTSWTFSVLIKETFMAIDVAWTTSTTWPEYLMNAFMIWSSPLNDCDHQKRIFQF